MADFATFPLEQKSNTQLFLSYYLKNPKFLILSIVKTGILNPKNTRTVISKVLHWTKNWSTTLPAM